MPREIYPSIGARDRLIDLALGNVKKSAPGELDMAKNNLYAKADEAATKRTRNPLKRYGLKRRLARELDQAASRFEQSVNLFEASNQVRSMSTSLRPENGNYNYLLQEGVEITIHTSWDNIEIRSVYVNDIVAGENHKKQLAARFGGLHNRVRNEYLILAEKQIAPIVTRIT